MEKEVSGRKISEEIARLSDKLEKISDSGERRLIQEHIKDLKEKLKKTNNSSENSKNRKQLNDFKENKGSKKIKSEKINSPIGDEVLNSELREIEKINKPMELEKKALQRIKKGEEKEIKKKLKKASKYVKFSNDLFVDYSRKLEKKTFFSPLKRDLIKANLQFIPASYISFMILTTLLSFFGSIFVFLFFLFFNVGAELPFITLVEGSMLIRLLKVFWIMLAIPIVTFLFIYYYPAMEKKSAENKINQELPFATIHMAAVSGSLIDPSNIFKIIISTGEYEYLGREFTKLINEINVYGYDLVGALRRSAFNSPSRRLSDLFNGLATTITSGGDLPEFFDKRSQTLLFEYRLEREKYTRSAETFMDIYISVVIAAPMILMLLLIMMSVSGLGISLEANMIALIMVLGVSLINVLFLTFLNLKQPST